jgi:hypothetical protein
MKSKVSDVFLEWPHQILQMATSRLRIVSGAVIRVLISPEALQERHVRSDHRKPESLSVHR